MDLTQLKENKLMKLDTVLKEVFGTTFNFSAKPGQLLKVKEATISKINTLKENGIDVDNKQFQKLLLVIEGINEVIMEQDLDQAEVLLAAKQMADDLQKMAEDLASMQVEELMSITNAMKEELGVEQAEAFSASAESAIASALEAVKAANEGVNNAVLVAQGQAPATDMEMDADMDTDIDGEMGDEMSMDEPADDEFAGVDAASSETDASGREMKEDSYLAALRMVKEAQVNGKVSKEVLNKAYALFKK